MLVYAAPERLNRNPDEAAIDLRSRPWRATWDITLPVIAPAILAGWHLAYPISLNDVAITTFTTSPGGNAAAHDLVQGADGGDARRERDGDAHGACGGVGMVLAKGAPYPAGGA